MSTNANNMQNIRKPMMVFLPLAPATSGSQPTSQSKQPAVRRTSSLSSTSSTQSQRMRFLRLGPVHNGEDLEEAIE
ncbi:hypothetical protein SCUP234_10942 [Seiridium cupressi]|uniref:Uncharacterized protein n=2 Tax=Seiridium TaxID=138063 RepID=A0ABR2VBZ1_9PEZI